MGIETIGHLNQQEEIPITHTHRTKAQVIITILNRVIQQIHTPINLMNPHLNPNWDLEAMESTKKTINIMIEVMIVMESMLKTSQALTLWQF